MGALKKVLMRTPIGRALHFELRATYVPLTRTKMRKLWLVIDEAGGRRPASDVEVRLWLSLPNKMRLKTEK